MSKEADRYKERKGVGGQRQTEKGREANTGPL